METFTLTFSVWFCIYFLFDGVNSGAGLQSVIIIVNWYFYFVLCFVHGGNYFQIVDIHYLDLVCI